MRDIENIIDLLEEVKASSDGFVCVDQFGHVINFNNIDTETISDDAHEIEEVLLSIIAVYVKSEVSAYSLFELTDALDVYSPTDEFVRIAGNVLYYLTDTDTGEFNLWTIIDVPKIKEVLSALDI